MDELMKLKVMDYEGINVILTMTKARQKYNLGLTEAMDLVCFLFKDELGEMAHDGRISEGKKIAERLNG